MKISSDLFNQATEGWEPLQWRLTNPDQIIHCCKAEFGKLGVPIRRKWTRSSFSSYRLGKLHLSRDFESSAIEHQAKVLEHELTHAKQDKQQGAWGLKYLLRP